MEKESKRDEKEGGSSSREKGEEKEREREREKGTEEAHRRERYPGFRPWPTLQECSAMSLPKTLLFTSTWLSVTAKKIKSVENTKIFASNLWIIFVSK